MTCRVAVRPREYHDSVRLMQVSEQVRHLGGVEEAILMMATDNNKKILASAGLTSREVVGAARDDLVIGVIAGSAAQADAALTRAVDLLLQRARKAGSRQHASLQAAMSAMRDANIALISIPGEFAVSETRKALQNGLNVMLFSDNVPLDEEVQLKRFAEERGRLLMGPDCGTAIINGCGLGFANAVRRGGVGIVGASGTGIQEIAVQLHRRGLGISHAIGTGGRDLKSAVGGLTMLRGIDALAADPGTEVLVLTSKPPDRDVAGRVLDKAAACGKPVVVNFLDADHGAAARSGLVSAVTLTEAAEKAMQLLRYGRIGTAASPGSHVKLDRTANEACRALSPAQRYVRGLFCGGTLCYEAMLVLRNYVGPVYSNIAVQPDCRLDDPSRSRAHSLIDMGDDRFTRHRAHPMIDPEQRNARLRQEAADDGVAVILLDLVLGYGSHEDPAASLAEAVRSARTLAANEGRELIVIASVCGTELDPQGLTRQQELLRGAGVLLAASNSEASRLAGMIAAAAAEPAAWRE